MITAVSTLTSAEFKKAKHKHTLLLILSAVILNYFYLFNAMPSTGKEWTNILFGIPMINTLLLSVLMTVLASRTVDIENKGSMWNLLPTLNNRTHIYLGKLCYGFINLTLFCIIQMCMVVFIGIHSGFSGVVPLSAILRTFFAEIISGMIIFQMQSLLSLIFYNQFAALSIGFGGILTGLFMAYISSKPWTPWSVLLSLSTVDMNFDSAARIMSLSFNHISIMGIFIAFLYLLGTFLLGLYLFTRSEQDTSILGFKRHIVSTSLHSSLPAELIKLKRNPIWLSFILIPVISAVIGTINFKANREVLKFTWEALWTQQSLFLGLFFLSPLIGILSSLLWRMEHSGSNWNLILTVTSPVKLIKDKWITAGIMSSLSIIWIVIIYIFSGKILGLPGNIPVQFLYRILCSILCVVTIAAVQCTLSMIIHSFAIPVALAFAGSLAGVALTVKGFYYVTPFSALIYGMGSTSITGTLNVAALIGSCLFYLVLVFIISNIYLRKADVRTQV